MARKKTKAWGGPPPRLRTVFAGDGEPEPAKTPVPDTEAGIMEAIVACCDALDIGMRKPTRGATNLMHPSRYDRGGEWLVDLRNRMVELTEALSRLVPEERRDEDGDVESLVQAALAVEPGIVPPWSRPGTFLCWVGFIPVRCIWGGFAFPNSSMTPADPGMPWISSNFSHGRIEVDHVTPEHVFRWELLSHTVATTWRKNQRVPTFALEPLSAFNREKAAGYLAGSPWLRKALAKGPVDAIPLPKHVEGVQLAL